MISVGGLQVQKGRGSGGGPVPPFNPAQLYSGGQQGTWYDQSDFTTGFQDSAGTIPQTVVEQPTGRRSDKSGRGNHGLQVTAAARPVVSARVNLLVTSNRFYDAGAGAGMTRTPNYAVGVDGTSFDATRYIWASQSNSYDVSSQLPGVAGTKYFCSFNVKSNSAGSSNIYFYFGVPDNSQTASLVLSPSFGFVSSSATAFFSIPTNFSAIAVANGYTKISFETTLTTALPNTLLGFASASAGTGDYTVWGGSVSTQATAYQRVTTSTDYNTVGFPTYDKVNGTQSSLVSSTGGGFPSSFFFCQAVKPLTGGVLQTIWSDATANTGFRLRINAANKLELGGGKGVASASPTITSGTANATGGTLNPSTNWYYILTAMGPSGESQGSNEFLVTTAPALGTQSITLNWTAVPGINYYRLYRGNSSPGTQNIAINVGNVLTYTDTNSGFSAGTPPAFDSQFGKLETVATLPVGTTSLITAWDDNTNFNVQIDSGAVITMARPFVQPGTAGFSVGVSNIAAGSYFNGNLYSSIYRQANLTTVERENVQAYCRSKAGL